MLIARCCCDMPRGGSLQPPTAPPRPQTLTNSLSDGKLLSGRLIMYDGSCSFVPYSYGVLQNADEQKFFFMRAHTIKCLMASSLRIGEELYFHAAEVPNILSEGVTYWAYNVRRKLRRRWTPSALKANVTESDRNCSEELIQESGEKAFASKSRSRKARIAFPAKMLQRFMNDSRELETNRKEHLTHLVESPGTKDKRLMPPPPLPPPKIQKTSLDDGGRGPSTNDSLSCVQTADAPVKEVLDEDKAVSIDTDMTTLDHIVEKLISGGFGAQSWCESIEVFYGVPLAALLDDELSTINKVIAKEAARIGSNNKQPRVEWNGVVL